jgi:hypothetical protein
VTIRAAKVGKAELLLLVGSLALSGGLVEILLRIMLFSGLAPSVAMSLVGFVSAPGTDDAYRIELAVQRRRHPARNSTFTTFDPTLGHTARPRTPDNPLGLAEERPYSLDQLRSGHHMLFFGDSFTEGFTEYPDKIPQLLDRTLRNVRVLNFGVMGYGLDQMYLRMMQTAGLFDHPHLVFGVLFDDMDRVVFRVREAPKPIFMLVNGRLELHNVPLPASYEDWARAYPPSERSYALALLRGTVNRVLKTHWAYDHAFGLTPGERLGGRKDKMRVVAALVRAIKTEAARRGNRLTFVIFPHPEHLTHRGWREEFLTTLLRAEGIDYIDLKEPLLRRLRQSNLRWWRDVYGLENHPTVSENQLLAGYIAQCLTERYGYGLALSPAALASTTGLC